MKKVLIALGIIAFLLVVTNPDHDDFGDWIQKRVEKEIQKEIGKDLGKDNPFTDLIKGAAGLTKFISKAATRDNYYLFSVYTLGKDKFLGIGGQFVPLNKIKENYKDFGLQKNGFEY